MKKGAIFDQDGLMFDTEAVFSRAWDTSSREFGITLPEGFRAAVSGSNGATMHRIVRQWIPGVDADAFIRRTYQLSYGLQRLSLPEKPGLHEILEFFRDRGVRLAVASSSHREPVLHNLERSGILTLFSAIVTGEDIVHSKPDPDAFLTAAARLGLDPADCYVFEDSFNGVRAGHAAGCCTIMIPDLFQPDQEITQCCDACFPDLLTAMDAIRDGRVG